MGNNTGYIYTLIDPRTNLVRYVGQTINEPYKRLAQHNCNYKRKIGKIRHSDAWIKNLHKNNLRPIMEVIDECSIDELNNKEIEYIKLYKSIGAKLCNHSTGGESGRGCKMSEESIKKRLETCKTSEAWKAKGAIHSKVMKQKHKDETNKFGYMNLPEERRKEIGQKIVESKKNNCIIKIQSDIDGIITFKSIKDMINHFKCNAGTVRDFIYNKRKTRVFLNYKILEIQIKQNKNKYDK